jgi:rubrerythrin
MDQNFNPQEILKIAINVEKNGRKLYLALAQAAQEPQIKKVWDYLAEQEQKHQQRFQHILDNLKQYLYYDYNPGEYDTYLRAIASEYIFTQHLVEEKLNKEFTSNLEAINFGIYIEKDSIITYSALREFMVTEKQEALEEIIAQEKEHLTQLIDLRQSIFRK